MSETADLRKRIAAFSADLGISPFEAANVDRVKFNDAVNDGFYPCAPAVVGKARLFPGNDLVSLYIFGALLALGCTSRVAGAYACDAHRQIDEAIDSGHTELGVQLLNDSGEEPAVFITIDLKRVVADLERRIADSKAPADEDWANAWTEDAKGRRTLVGLTYEETLEVEEHRRRRFETRSRSSRKDQQRFLGLQEKHEAARIKRIGKDEARRRAGDSG